MKVTIHSVVCDSLLLDAALRARLMTPVELAARLGVNRVTVWRARRGEPIRLPLARRLARTLRIPLRKLVAASAVADASRWPTAAQASAGILCSGTGGRGVEARHG